MPYADLEVYRTYHRTYKRRWAYGITEETYEALLSSQNGRCAICGVELGDKGTVDHDHACCPGYRSCGQCIRGILCKPCNTGLGHFSDDPAHLRAAADFLELNHPNPQKT